MVTMESVERFLGGRRFAVVGASDGKDNFGGTIYRELRSHGYDVVAGACPLMFLEPVGWFHRVHRAVRRANGALVARAA